MRNNWYGDQNGFCSLKNCDLITSSVARTSTQERTRYLYLYLSYYTKCVHRQTVRFAHELARHPRDRIKACRCTQPTNNPNLNPQRSTTRTGQNAALSQCFADHAKGCADNALANQIRRMHVLRVFLPSCNSYWLTAPKTIQNKKNNSTELPSVRNTNMPIV